MPGTVRPEVQEAHILSNYLVKRILGTVPVFFGITIVVFLMMNLAPATIADLAGEQGEASSAAEKAALEAKLGLERPVIVRYGEWLWRLLHGDLGNSYRTGQPVMEAIAQRVLPSLILTGTGVLTAILLGIPLGVMAAWKPGSFWDKFATGIPILSFGIPNFCLCLFGIYIFAVLLGVLPAAGMYTVGDRGSLFDLFRHLILPASVVCISSMGTLIRQTRSACREVLGEDFMTTAWAKGLSTVAVIWKHGFRAAVTPIFTTILGHIPHIVGGSMIVERIFAWPGMGSLLFLSVSSRDYTMIMGVTVVTALAVLLTNLILDLAYHLIDPRIRWKGVEI